jgi:hypothetical protein
VQVLRLTGLSSTIQKWVSLTDRKARFWEKNLYYREREREREKEKEREWERERDKETERQRERT